MHFLHYSLVLLFLVGTSLHKTDGQDIYQSTQSRRRLEGRNIENVLGEGRFTTAVLNKLVALKASLTTTTTNATTTTPSATSTTTTTAPTNPTNPTMPIAPIVVRNRPTQWIRIPIRQQLQKVQRKNMLQTQQQNQQRVQEQAVDQAIELVLRQLKQERLRRQQAQNRRQQVKNQNVRVQTLNRRKNRSRIERIEI